MNDPLVAVFAVAVSGTLGFFAMRDLYLNFRSDPAVWRGIAHSRARTAALAGAATAMFLLDISAPVAIGAWVWSVLFVFFPSNEWLTKSGGRAEEEAQRKATIKARQRAKKKAAAARVVSKDGGVS